MPFSEICLKENTCHVTLKVNDNDIDPAYPVELTIFTYKLHDSSNPESCNCTNLKDFVNWSYDRQYGWKKVLMNGPRRVHYLAADEGIY